MEFPAGHETTPAQRGATRPAGRRPELMHMSMIGRMAGREGPPCCVIVLEKCRHCGASLSEFADVAHGRVYAALQTYMYVDVRTYIRNLCAESAL